MFGSAHANAKKLYSEHSWLSGWVNLSILAHLAHLAQSYFSDFQCNQYIQLLLIWSNKKKFQWLTQKHGEKWLMLTTFFLTATAAITGNQTNMFLAIFKPDFCLFQTIQLDTICSSLDPVRDLILLPPCFIIIYKTWRSKKSWEKIIIIAILLTPLVIGCRMATHR